MAVNQSDLAYNEDINQQLLAIIELVEQANGERVVDTFVDTLGGNEEVYREFIQSRYDGRGLANEDWYEGTLHQFIKWLVQPVTKVTKRMVVQYLSKWNDKPQSKKSKRTALHAFYKWLSSEYDCPNPFLDAHGNECIPVPKIPYKIQPAMKPEPIKELLGKTASFRDSVIVALLAESGARRAEIASIKLGDIDLPNGTVRIWGKGGKQRDIIIGNHSKVLLETYLGINGSSKSFHRKVRGDSLFGMTGQALGKMITRLGKATGITVTPHAFRRGFASTQMANGVSASDIMRMGGWSGLPMVTLYTRSVTFDQAKANYVNPL